MSNSQAAPDLQALFSGLSNDGVLSGNSIQALNVNDIGAAIQAGLGVAVDDVTSSDVVLVNILVDDSGSISYSNNTKTLRDSVNGVLEALSSSKSKDGILVQIRLMNGVGGNNVINPFSSLDSAVKLNGNNYNERNFAGTPLYDTAVETLGTALAKAQDFSDNGVPVRSITLFATDGADASSRRATAASVKTVVRDMLAQETHIIAFLGIDDGTGCNNFKQVALDMGIPDKWILTPGSDPKEIRNAFQLFSQSAVAASQATGAGFSQVAGGGFGG